MISATGCLGMPDASDWIPIEEVAGAEVGTTASTDQSGAPIRITTFNAELGRDVEAIAIAFESVPELALTDVLLVQEIESHPGESGSRASRLAARLDMSYAYAPARDVGGGATHGLAILTRHELSGVEVMQLRSFEFHINSRKRIALAAYVDELRVINVHLDTRLNITERVLQLDPVVATSPETVAVAGDFNTNPYIWVDGTVPLTNVDAVSDFDQASVLDGYMADNGFDTPTRDSGPTQDARVVELRLDSIYTRQLPVSDTGVVRGLGLSDHRPLWVDVTTGDRSRAGGRRCSAGCAGPVARR